MGQRVTALNLSSLSRVPRRRGRCGDRRTASQPPAPQPPAPRPRLLQAVRRSLCRGRQVLLRPLHLRGLHRSHLPLVGPLTELSAGPSRTPARRRRRSAFPWRCSRRRQPLVLPGRRPAAPLRSRHQLRPFALPMCYSRRRGPLVFPGQRPMAPPRCCHQRRPSAPSRRCSRRR